MSKHKQHKKPTHWRGRPVKPKVAPRGRGRGPLPADPELAKIPPGDTTRTQVPSTLTERERWGRAASITERRLGLAPGALSVGPWARRALNHAANAAIDDAESAIRAASRAFAPTVKP